MLSKKSHELINGHKIKCYKDEEIYHVVFTDEKLEWNALRFRIIPSTSSYNSTFVIKENYLGERISYINLPEFAKEVLDQELKKDKIEIKPPFSIDWYGIDSDD